MQPQDMILVSVDDHLVAPPNLFAGKMLSKFADEAPKVIRKGDGSEIWTFELAGVTDGVADDEINKITYENACRWYNFDPFKHRTREKCSVRALRAEASDHDVAIRTFDHGRFERTAGASLGSVGAKLNV